MASVVCVCVCVHGCVCVCVRERGCARVFSLQARAVDIGKIMHDSALAFLNACLSQCLKAAGKGPDVE